MKGVLRGFKKKIEVFGMGYKVNFDESTNSFILFIGYSHSIKYKIPSNVFVKILKKNQVSLSSVNYQALMQTIATLKSFKKVDVYKGKGIKLQGEKLVLKEGKKSKK
jgi:large subunit ribosomal protein L6